MKLAHSRNDLPNSWDGEPVEWTGWTAHRSTMIYHAPPDVFCCRQCGTVDERLINFGKRPPETATYPSTRTRTTRSGRTYEQEIEVPSWPVVDLVASRCRHCRHDVVTDLRTDQVWDLEDEDYGPDGSNPPQPETLF
jgi:hypothetical protein